MAKDKDLKEGLKRLDKLRKEAKRLVEGKTSKADAHRADMRQRSLAKSRAGQEIGDLPPVKDPIRKSECGESLELFQRTYFPATFYLPFSDMHRTVIAKTEHVIRHGGMHALALPRGSGKTAGGRASAIWAIVYGYTKYVYFIGANADSSRKNLDAIKAMIWSPLLLEDFPEAIYPLRMLERQPRLCAGQTYHGEQTLSQWSKKAVVFPTIPGSKASGGVFNVDGISAGFRGADFTHPGGEMVRPGYVIIDDPQTDSSSKSDSQCETREAMISGAILGLAGPDKRLSAIMPCTVIRQGDLADRMLNTKTHPEWNGSRFGLVKSFPADAERWAAYREKLVAFNPDIPGDAARAEQEAQEFYFDNHQAMSMGAELTWPERFSPDCLDALEFAMRLKFRDERSFFAEYQNTPVPPKTNESLVMKPAAVAAKLSGTPRLHAPVTTTRLTLGIDVQKNVLYYVVTAWEENFTGFIVDYGTYPEQRLPYFKYSEVQHTLAKATGIQGEEGQLYAGLDNLTKQLMGREWQRGLDAAARIERCIVDAGYQSDLIYQFARQSLHAANITPSHGKGIGAKNLPMNLWKRPPGDRRGLNWFLSTAEKRAIKYVLFDSNFWKSFIHARLWVAQGNPGCLSIFGTDEKSHRMLADQICSEYPTSVTANGRTVDEWTMKPNADNHFLDALVLSAVGASMQGVSLAGVHQGQPQKPRVSFAESQRAAQQKKQGR